MIEIIFQDNNVILAMTEISGKIDRQTQMGIMRAQVHMQRMISNNLSSGKFGIKTRGWGLSGSIYISPIMQVGNDLVGFVGSNLVYARIQEVGGDIFPKNAPYLHFKVNGQWVRTKHVHMPPKHYMGQTLDEESPRLLDIMREAQAEAMP